jgi:hypothetical protein
MGDFATAFTAQIALKQRLKHQNQWKPAIALHQLPADISANARLLNKRNSQNDLLIGIFNREPSSPKRRLHFSYNRKRVPATERTRSISPTNPNTTTQNAIPCSRTVTLRQP